MATSGSYDFSATRDSLILTAHQHIQVVGENGTNTAAQVTEAAILLNMIVKLRAADGMPAWALKRGYLLPTTDVSSIQTDSHATTNYDTTTLTADSAASDTTLTVTSITGFTNGDQIGIELDDGTVDWTTINGVPAGTTITITTGVTTAASSGNRVYGYTASSERIQKPLRIIGANVLDVTNSRRNAIDVISREEYYSINNYTSTSTGGPLVIFYDQVSNSATNLDDGNVYFWPRFEGGDNIVEFTYQRPFQDFDASGDNVDFPQAFYLPLMLELAALLGPKFGVPRDVNKDNLAMAKLYRDEALYTVAEEGSMRISPEDRG